MKVFLALCFILFIHVARSQYGTLDEEWEKFKVKFNKSYESPAEEASRKEIFAGTLKRVIEHNRRYEKGEVTFGMGLNQFADLEFDEVPHGLRPPFTSVED